MSAGTRESPASTAAPPDDDLARHLRGFGPLGIAVMLVLFAVGPILEPLGGVLVLAWGARSRTPWRDLGLVRPRRRALTLLGGIAFGAAFKLCMKAIVMPLLGADPV